MVSKTLLLASLASLSMAYVPLERRQTFTGVATFNNYGAQGNTVCGQSHAPGTYGAAIGDLSPNIWTGAKCSTNDMPACSGPGGSAPSGYAGPSCANTTCGQCFQVCNEGGYGNAPVNGRGNCVKVQVIDVCPSESADNYCKANQGIPADERCGSSSTNALDIDESAYSVLTNGGQLGGPNLMINITPTSC